MKARCLIPIASLAMKSRHLPALITLTIALCAILHAQDTNAPQSWTASDGRVMQAKFIKLDGESVIIEKDGKEFAVPLAKLAPESVALAKKLGGVAPAQPGKAETVAYPAPIEEPVKIFKVHVWPNGEVVARGSKNFRWSPATQKWAPDEAARIGAVKVSPLNEHHYLSERSVSEDGGKTWKEVIPAQYSRSRNYEAFWHTKKPGTVLLAEVKFGSEGSCAILELDVATGKASPVAKTAPPTLIYAQKDGKLYGMEKPIDFLPNATSVSADDGLTWKPVPPEETPWALELSAQAQMEKLVPNAKDKRPYVDSAFEVSGVAFCQVESQVGETFDPAQPLLFTSADHGKTWTPAPLDQRTSDVRTLFAGCPFVGKDPTGKPIIDPSRPLRLEYDAKGQRLFAQLGHGLDEWFVTSPSDHEWHRINQAPQ